MKYRSEIDGLRAVAVVPVILFHAGFEIFSGGFVGVDVFFVISGYLITTIIINEMDEGKFSLLNFYERRARRILPALFFVVLCCIPFAWYLLVPSDMKDFSQSLVAVATFSSNILFWRESGYFETAAELKPLLHTWSLAVEEQFYILFPLFLMAAWRFGKRAIVWTLFAAFIISLATAQWGVYNKPAATFYLLPTRAWELLIGSFAAFYLQRRRVSTAAWVSNALSAVGLAAILYGVFAFDYATPFPSFYALVPTVGTVLIILFAVRGTAVHSLLSIRGFVGVGLISYSLYLWHQPVFAFWRHYHVFEPTHLHMVILSIACLPLAYLTYRFVEHPSRIRKSYSSRNLVFFGAGGGMILMSLIGLGGHFSNGAINRYAPDQQEMLALGNYEVSFREYGLGECFIDYDQDYQTLIDAECVSLNSAQPNIIIFGDSEAAHLMVGFREQFFGADISLHQWTGASCRPFVQEATNDRCRDFFNEFLELVNGGLTGQDFIVVSGNWSNSLNDDFTENVRASFSALSQLGAQIIVIGDTPNFSIPPLQYVVQRQLFDQGQVLLPPRRDSVGGITNAIVDELVEEFSFSFVDPDVIFCNQNSGQIGCVVWEANQPVFFDGNHLSYAGSRMLGGMVGAMIMESLSQP